MSKPEPDALGTEDLERGLRPTPISDFRTVAFIALVVLLLFNSAGLVKWTQQLPSNTVNVWLAERAADWDRLMQATPARGIDRLRRLLSGE